MNPAFQLLKTLFRKHAALIISASVATGAGFVFMGFFPTTAAEVLDKLFIFLAGGLLSVPVSFCLAWCYDTWAPASLSKVRLSFLLVTVAGGMLPFNSLFPEWLGLIELWIVTLGGLVAAALVVIVRFRKTPLELLAWLVALFVWLVISCIYFFLMEGFFFPRYC